MHPLMNYCSLTSFLLIQVCWNPAMCHTPALPPFPLGPWLLQGDKVVKMNIDGVDASIEGIVQVDIPAAWASLDLGSEAGSSTVTGVGGWEICSWHLDRYLPNGGIKLVVTIQEFVQHPTLVPSQCVPIDSIVTCSWRVASECLAFFAGHRCQEAEGGLCQGAKDVPRGTRCRAVCQTSPVAVQQPRWQRTSSECLRARWSSAMRYKSVRETRYCHQRAQGWHGQVHSVQQVQSHLPPCGSATIPGHWTRARKGTRSFQGWQPFSHRRWCLGQLPVPHPGLPMGLHRLWVVRPHLPCWCIDPGTCREGDSGRGSQLELRSDPPRSWWWDWQDHREGLPVPEAVSRVQRCLRRMWWDSSCEAHDSAFRRSTRDCQCDRPLPDKLCVDALPSNFHFGLIAYQYSYDIYIHEIYDIRSRFKTFHASLSNMPFSCQFSMFYFQCRSF